MQRGNVYRETGERKRAEWNGFTPITAKTEPHIEYQENLV